MNCCLPLAFAALIPAAQPERFDVVIYGGTSGGIAAAIQVQRMGKKAVLIEPTARIGGMTTHGLGQTDIGNKAAIGGISREFYERIAKHYADPDAWKWQKREDYRSGGQSRTDKGESAMWTFEPGVAVSVFQDMLEDAGVSVVTGERLERKHGVQMTGRRIVGLKTESGREFIGKVFIDATYEGDLVGSSGVSYTVGREPNSWYDETLNGVQTRRAVHHQLRLGIDPFVVKGDPESGLLPGIDPTGPGAEGSGDRRMQAYCFRMCLTDHPENRIEIAKPEGYDEKQYELLFRNFEAGEKRMPWNLGQMPNRKTDINNNLGVSTDYIGQNYAYPEASYEDRERITREHLKYQSGLMWTLANHPRVPEHIREQVAPWGLCKDEFTDSGGWPPQLYVREGRRLVGELVMTQHHCQGHVTVKDPVGLAAYTMDSHNVQRYVDAEGQVRNEGDVQVGGFPPYPIGYLALTPKSRECSNLLVPVALSASHMAFGSIRMEPVFMVLGQSAGTAACLALDDGVAVQKLDYAKLGERLRKDGQVLEWTGPRPRHPESIDPAKLPGVVVDDRDAELQGFAEPSVSMSPFVGPGYRHDGDEAKGRQTARFVPELPEGGEYEVRLAYSTHENRAGKVPVTIRHAGGSEVKHIDQRKKPPIDKAWVSLGKFRFEKGDAGWVEVSNAGTDGFVVVDAVQFLPAKRE